MHSRLKQKKNHLAWICFIFSLIILKRQEVIFAQFYTSNRNRYEKTFGHGEIYKPYPLLVIYISLAIEKFLKNQNLR